MGDTIKVFDRNGVPQGLLFDKDGALVLMSMRDYLIHIGKYWYTTGFARITGADTKKYLLMRVPTMVSGTFDVHMNWIFSADAEFEMRIFGQPTVTAFGTPLSVRNRNIRYQSSSQYIKMLKDPTVTDNGELAFESIVGSGKSNVSGHEAKGEFVVFEGLTYILEIIKVAAGDGWFAWEFSWAEDIDGTVIEFTTSTTTTTTTTTGA